LSTIDTFIAKGINLFRINFSQERLVPNQLAGPMNDTYFSDLKKVRFIFYSLSRIAS